MTSVADNALLNKRVNDVYNAIYFHTQFFLLPVQYIIGANMIELSYMIYYKLLTGIETNLFLWKVYTW
jgi:hypothetical protein